MNLAKLVVIGLAVVFASAGVGAALSDWRSGDPGPPIDLVSDEEARKDDSTDVATAEDDGDGDGDDTNGNDGTSGGNNTVRGDGDNTRGNDGTSGGDNTAAPAQAPAAGGGDSASGGGDSASGGGATT